MASVASERSSELKIPYISPTGIVRNIFENDYSISLGTSVWDATRGLNKLLNRLENPKLIIVEATNQIQEKEYSDAIRSTYKDVISIQYQGEFPTSNILSTIKNFSDERFLVFIPGYTNVKHGIKSILSKYPSTKFVVGPQWSHDHRLLDFDAELYSISDYYNFLNNDIHEDIKERWLSEGGEIIGGYLYALYDALYFALLSLNSEHVISRDDALESMNNLGRYFGSKGKLDIKDGKVSKNVYILKYKKEDGFNLIEST